jgi:hypothetical protein
MLQPEFYSRPILVLHKELDNGRFAVPKLQRAFVWNGRKAAQLLDSIYHGMPIGAITVWDTSHRNMHLLRHTLNVLPPYQQWRRVWFVLDGQQRLSVLHQMLSANEVVTSDHKVVDFGKLVFRFTQAIDEPLFAYRNPDEEMHIPVFRLLSPTWSAKVRHLSEGQRNRIRECRERLLGYRVPVVRVESDSIEQARELFIRINSLGTPLGAADRAFARAAAFDLRAQAETTWASVAPNFRNLSDEMLLQTRALLDGVLDVGERAYEQVVRLWNVRIGKDKAAVKRFTKVWRQQERALHRAIDLLRWRFSVLNDGLLPSQYMLATLTVFFVHREGAPSPGQMKQIARWFWATALGQRYSGRGFRQNILKDAAWFRKLARNASSKFVLSEKIDPMDLRLATYGKRSSVSDAFSCLLISQKPRRLTNGEPMPIDQLVSAANKKHRHHVFPRQLLANRQVPARRANSILNLCFLPADENASVGARQPRKYLEEYMGRGLKGKLLSHLIPSDESSGLWEPNVRKGFEMFLKRRAEVVVREFEKAAGAALFRS